MLRSIRKHFGVLLLHSVFLFGLTLYIRGHIIYHDVENWPSVPAQGVTQTGDVVSSTIQNKYGPPINHQIDTRRVEYLYEVDGQFYTGDRVSADSRGISYSLLERQLSAHYRPDKPEIAVLVPSPFSGMPYLGISIFLGLIVAGHLFFTIKLRDR